MDKQERSLSFQEELAMGGKMLLSEKQQHFQSPTLSVGGQCNQNT